MSEQKNLVKDVFNRCASTYGEEGCPFFNYFGERLVELSHLTSGKTVLDVATGKGAILFPASKKVGPTGKVIGIDISPNMIEETRKKVDPQNLSRVELYQMDAEKLKFPDNTFDHIFCGFALFFFPSLKAALEEFKRVLKSGGRLSATTWGEKSELSRWVNDEAKKMGALQKLQSTPLHDPHSLHQALKTEFDDVAIIEESKIFYHKTPEAWWESLWAHGTRANLEQLSPENLFDLKQRALIKAKKMTTSKGLAEKLTVFYGLVKHVASCR